MTPEDFIEALYRICLGRAADSTRLASWTELMRASGDPTLVLRGILGSPEYTGRTSAAQTGTDCAAEIQRSLGALDRRLRVVDVGAQSLGLHAYDSLLKICDVEIIGFDPLAERLRERAETETAPGLTLLPYAVGDGGTYTFYINNDDATSSLFALNEAGNACFNYLSDLRTVRTEQVTTRCLDDVLSEGPLDFLKLDVQGAELMALKRAERTLSRTAVVHCEVEFSPIYKPVKITR